MYKDIQWHCVKKELDFAGYKSFHVLTALYAPLFTKNMHPVTNKLTF